MIQEAYMQGISTRSVDNLVKAMGMLTPAWPLSDRQSTYPR